MTLDLSAADLALGGGGGLDGGIGLHVPMLAATLAPLRHPSSPNK